MDVARRLVHELKVEHKCDLVFAMTHMRWNNDTILAEQVPEIDLFLGGHDHDYVVKKVLTLTIRVYIYILNLIVDKRAMGGQEWH